MDTQITLRINKILEKMQADMAKEASGIRERVVSGRLPAADASNQADKMYQEQREKATASIIEFLDSRK